MIKRSDTTLQTHRLLSAFSKLHTWTNVPCGIVKVSKIESLFYNDPNTSSPFSFLSLQVNKCQMTCDAGTYYNGHRRTCEPCHRACATCAGKEHMIPEIKAKFCTWHHFQEALCCGIQMETRPGFCRKLIKSEYDDSVQGLWLLQLMRDYMDLPKAKNIESKPYCVALNRGIG